MKNVCQHVENSEKSKELPTNRVQQGSEVWIDLWHVLPEMWTELLTNTGGENI